MAYYNKKLGSGMLGQMTGQLDKDIASGKLKPANITQKTTTLRGETAKGKSLSALGKTAEDWRQRKTAKSTDEMTEEQLKKPFKADTLNMMYHQTVKKAHSWGSKDPLEDAYQLTCQYRDNVKASYAAGAKDPMAAAQKRYNQSMKELERKTGVQGKSYEELMDQLHSMGGYLTDKEWAESNMPKTEKNAMAVASGDMGSVYQQAKTEGDRLDFYQRLPQILATMDQAEAKKQNASALLSAEDQSQWADLMDSDAGWAWYESLSGKTAEERQQSAQAFAQKLLGEQPASSNAQSYLSRPKDSADVAWLKDYIRRNTSKGAQAWLEEATGTADEQAARDALYFAQYGEKEQALRQSPDYLEKSRADAQYSRDSLYKYINDIDGEREKSDSMADTGNRLGYRTYSRMTPEQIANYNYVYATEGKKAASEYLDYIKYDLNQQQAAQMNESMEELGQQGVGGAIAASALSVPFSVAGGLGALDIVGQNLRNLGGSYRPIDYNTGMSQISANASSARKGVQQQVDWNVNLLGHNLDVFDLLYGGAMSSIDSIVGAQMGSVLNTIRYTSAAAQEAALSAKEAGANDGQILGIMAAAGFAEWLGEAVPFDKFFKMAGSTDQQTLSRVIRNTLEEGFTNAPGEMVTEFSNALAQHLILGDKSDAAQEYQQYLELGLDEKEAWKRTAIDLGWQIGEAGLGGFLQGAGMGGAASLQSAQASRQMDFTAGERILTAKTGENLKALAMSLGTDTEVGQLGNQYNPETATARETGKLFRQIMNALPGEQNKGTVQDSVALDLASTLDAMGETGNLFSIANSILDVYQGYDLSEGQRLELAASAHGLEVLNALTAREAASNSAQAAAKSAMAAEAEARRTGAQADREAAEKARTAERQARAIRDGQYMQQAAQARQDTQQTPAAATADEGAAWLDAEPSVAEGAQTAPEVNQTTVEVAQTAQVTAQEAPEAAPVAAAGEAKAPAPNARQTAQEAETGRPEKQAAKKAPPEKPILSQAVRENGEKQESIRQIRESENGVEAVTESGKAVPVDELQVSDSQKTLLENSVGMDSRAAAEMVQDFREDGDQDAQDYSIGFQRIYNAARNGRTMEQIQTMFGDMLTPEQRQKAFDQGRQEAARLKAEAAEKRAADGKTNARLAQAYDFRTAAEAKGQGGLYFANVTKKLGNNVALTQLKLIDQFAKEYGLQVRVFDTLENGKANGMLEKGTNIINLALDAQEGALTRTVSHEAYHYIAQQSREQAEKLQNFVRERLEGKEGYDLLARIQEKQEQYRQNGANLTADEAMEEITADSVLDVIGTEKNLQALVKQDKTMAQRMGQVLRQIAERLKAIIQRFGRRSQEVQALSEDIDYVEKIAGMMEDALAAVRDNYRMATEGAFTAAKQDAAVQQYISDMSTAATDEDAQVAMNGLVSSLFARSQQQYLSANPDIELNKAVARFADALKAFGEGDVSMVQAALTRAGFDSPAAGDSIIAPLAYAGKKLAGMDERGMSTESKYFMKKNIQVISTENDKTLSLKETDIADQVAQDPVLQSQLQSDRSIRALAEMMDKLHKTVLRGDSFLQEGATEPALKAGAWERRTSAIADKMIQETGTKMSKQTIGRRLHTLYSAMDSINMDAGEALMFARSLARQMLEKSPGVVMEQDETTKAVVQAAKNNAFYLTEDMKSEIRDSYGSVQTYLRKNFGRMRIRSASGTTISLSEFWRETLNPLMPGTFSLDVDEADMPGILDAFLENAGQKRYSEAYGANLDQYATDLALGIMLEYYDVPGGIGKAEGLRQEFIKDREELRQSYQQRLTSQAEGLRQAFIKAREELRQSYAQRYQQRLTSQAERRQENQQRKSLRGQIERDSKYLAVRVNQPTDNRHVPEGLQGVAGALSQAIRASERFNEKALLELKAQYEAIGQEGSDYDAAGAYDGDILYTIGDMAKTLPGKKMTELTTQELQDLADVTGNLKKMIAGANEIFINGRKTTLDAAGEEVISQLSGKQDVRREKLKALAYKNTTPTYFFDNLGGQLKRCYDGMLEGQNQYAFNMRRAKEHMDGLIEKYHVNDWIRDKNHLKFETIQGKQVELNRDQALALYALWNRETRNKRQNANHLRIGGFMYRSSVKYRGVEKTRPHRITEADMRTVMSWLTQEQMDFADAAVRYLSTTMADLGNETSMALYGYKKYTEAYYFPYASSKDFIQQDLTKSDDSGTRQPKNMGMSKATVRNANNPIFLDGFMETWAGHVNQMCIYNGFAQPVDTLNRIFNYKTAGTDDAYGLSVKAELKRVYGQAAVTYLSNLARDVSGGVVAQERTGVNKWLSKFKKNAVAANLSVVIQQPSAIMRAMNMVSPKYFLRPANALKEAAEMEKYSGVALIKSMGRFDTGTGFTGEEWLTGSLKAETKLKQASAKMDEVTGWGAEQADRITWGTIWAAIKREISATTQLQEGTQEYFDAVARRFNDVMNHTQVYDSILVKSDIMRGKSTMDKMVTAFMAEPTVSYNMLQFAIQNLGKTDAAGRHIGRKAAVRAVAAFAANTLFNAMLKSLVSMGRRWEEEDRTILEKYLAELSENFTGDLNPLSMVPVARDIVSIWQGYDVERSDMSVVTDLKDAYDEAMNDEKSFGEKMIAVAGALGNLLGIPAKNVIRDFQGALNILGSAPMGETSGRDIKYGVLEGLSFLGMDLYDGGTGTYYERALDALEKGDEKTYEELSGYLTETRLKEESTVKSGIRYRMEDRAKAGSMTWDEYFALWREKLGGKSSNIRGKISTLYKDGRIDEGEAKALLKKYGEYKDENDIYYAIEKWNWQQENPDAEDDYSRYGKVYDAVKAGKDASGAIREMTQHGYTDAKVKSQIADKIGSWYIGGEMTRAAAETALKRYTDKTDGDDIWFQLRRWDYQKNHNGSGEGYSAYGDFYKAVETGTNLPSRIRELTDHGVSASTLAGKITSQYKQQYIQLYAKDKTKAAALKARLLTAYAALGYDRTKKNKDIEKWLKQDTKKK